LNPSISITHLNLTLALQAVVYKSSPLSMALIAVIQSTLVSSTFFVGSYSLYDCRVM